MNRKWPIEHLDENEHYHYHYHYRYHYFTSTMIPRITINKSIPVRPTILMAIGRVPLLIFWWEYKSMVRMTCLPTCPQGNPNLMTLILFLCRNLVRVLLTLFLVFLTKLLDTPWLLRSSWLATTQNTRNMTITCQVLSMVDHILMATMMFYIIGISLYMFCRQPNPTISENTDARLSKVAPKLYIIHMSIIVFIFKDT